jgi:hypothetical protein
MNPATPCKLSNINFISPREPKNQSDLPPAEHEVAKYAALLLLVSLAKAALIAVVFA